MIFTRLSRCCQARGKGGNDGDPESLPMLPCFLVTSNKVKASKSFTLTYRSSIEKKNSCYFSRHFIFYHFAEMLYEGKRSQSTFTDSDHWFYLLSLVSLNVSGSLK